MILLILPVQACSDTEEEHVVYKTVPEIQSIKPQKPVKIKLKRNTKGEYSWDISGDDADKVLEANRKLEESLEKKKKRD
ncbi:MAG: hypothetical protein JSV71_05705 [Nitrospiraceae bacterium]|nr:MAG: hypothetical protein JSV71_05705 [Nitrospiraceae bacterium]